MIRTIISDIGNVLSGFTWYDFYKGKGYSEEMVERLAKATVGSDIWKEYDRGVLSEEEILNRFIANDPELEEDLRKTLANVHGIMERYDYAIPWIEELKAKGYQFLVLSNFSRKVLRECWSDLDFLPEVDGGIGTIAMCVNMIPHVINARPGLKTMIDLPVPHAIMGDMRDQIEEGLLK